jgi:hypothetical protein
MFERTFDEGDVRAVLLADGWHDCRSLDFEDGLYSSTFEAVSLVLNNDGDTKIDDFITMQCYRFADADDVVYVGPLSAVLSMKVMPETLYLSHMESLAKRELEEGHQ